MRWPVILILHASVRLREEADVTHKHELPILHKNHALILGRDCHDFNVNSTLIEQYHITILLAWTI